MTQTELLELLTKFQQVEVLLKIYGNAFTNTDPSLFKERDWFDDEWNVSYRPANGGGWIITANGKVRKTLYIRDSTAVESTWWRGFLPDCDNGYKEIYA